MQKIKKYVDFKDLTFDEKNDTIYTTIINNTSKEWLANKILEKIIEISPSRKWKDCVGCPVVKIDKITYREINSRFPLSKVIEIVRQKFNQESFENETNQNV